MGEAVGRTVLRLTRIAFAGLTLEGLRAGQMRPLHPLELAELKQKYLHSVARPRRPRSGAPAAQPAVTESESLLTAPRDKPRPARASQPQVARGAGKRPARATSARRAR
jgi:hypothetical protein